MDDLLASMRDLAGGHALPILAPRAHAAPQPLHSPRERSAFIASVADQLSALKALQQEGAQALAAAHQVCALPLCRRLALAHDSPSC